MGTVDQEKLKKLEAVKLSLEKDFGKGIVSKLNSGAVEGVEFLPTSIMEFDELSGGGFPRGRIIEIYGPESSGKTTLALHAIESAQRAGGVCAFIDMEHALDPIYAQNLGVDIDNLWVSQPESGEQGLEVTEQMVSSGVVDVIVFDSVAAAIPQKELDGDYGDSNMGLQARLMSQAMRKLTGTISKTNCIVIFINQIRHKIGVMFGCFSYNTRVCLSDGTTEKIGKIVNQKMDVEVLSFNPDTDRIESKKIINYFNNGKAESFLDFVVEKPYGNGRSNFSCTKNHIILTPEGEVNASDLKVNDYVLGQGKYLFSKEQEEVIIGSLLGDGCICSPTNRFKVAHGIKQNEYCLYKMSLFSNLNPIQYNHAKGGIAFEIGNSEELNYYRSLCYGVDNKKRLITKEFISKLTEKAIAIWFMDDGNLSGSHTKWGNGKIAISVKSYSFEEIELLKNYLSDNGYGEATITKTKRLEFNGTESEKFQFKIAKWIHPSMRYKIIERFHTIPFEAINPNFKKPMYKLVPRKILSIKESSKKRSMAKFDLEIEDNHNYLVDGVGVHNSPETTCVTPDTMIEIEENESMGASLNMEDLFKKVNLDYRQMEKNIPYDVSSKNIKIKSFNHEKNEVEFKKILSLVHKDDVIGYNLVTKTGDILLKCSGDHRIFDNEKKQYIKVKDIESGSALTNSGESLTFFVKKTNETYPIVDMEVEDNENYFTNGLLSHNTGGNALKFYSSQRFDIRKIETITGKDSEDATANKVRVKCVKNKVAPPFKKAEFLIEFGKGFNKLDSLVNVAVKLEVIDKKGAWYSYKEEKIGQGKENVLKFLTENPELYNEIYSICSDRLFKKCINTQKAEVVEEKKKKVKKEKDIEISIDAPEEDTIEQESME